MSTLGQLLVVDRGQAPRGHKPHHYGVGVEVVVAMVMAARLVAHFIPYGAHMNFLQEPRPVSAPNTQRSAGVRR
ncbi:hypothetical protein V6K52_19170 [Knoellia sp. S7-12]|uniref:hypothetical protein n=1 Tax=Knoellia sp. S7-12 TaxID=3126698 RepID=UPI00336687EA